MKISCLKAITGLYIAGLLPLVSLSGASSLPEIKDTATVLPATASCVAYTGRTCTEDGGVVLSFPGTEIRIRFRGPALELTGEVLTGDNWFNLRIDGKPRPRVDVPKGQFTIRLADKLDPESIHEVRLVRRNEAWQGTIRLDSFILPDGGDFTGGITNRSRRILCIGDSITCGERTEFIPPYAPDGKSTANAELSYGWQLAKLLDADVHLVSYGGKGVVRDWQGNTDNVKAIELFERSHSNRPAPLWNHASYQPQLVIICLGTNDYATGIVDREPYVTAYLHLVDRVHEVHPDARILLMSSPMLPGYAPEKAAHLLGVLREVKATFSKSEPGLVELLEIGDYSGTLWNSHPTGPQQKEMADKLHSFVAGWLGWSSGE